MPPAQNLAVFLAPAILKNMSTFPTIVTCRLTSGIAIACYVVWFPTFEGVWGLFSYLLPLTLLSLPQGFLHLVQSTWLLNFLMVWVTSTLWYIRMTSLALTIVCAWVPLGNSFSWKVKFSGRALNKWNQRSELRISVGTPGNDQFSSFSMSCAN